jgi:hypothetical protein
LIISSVAFGLGFLQFLLANQHIHHIDPVNNFWDFSDVGIMCAKLDMKGHKEIVLAQMH